MATREWLRSVFGSRATPDYLEGWDGASDLEDLKSYLGAEFDEQRLWNHRRLVDDEEEQSGSEGEFYRSSQAYLYDLTVFAMSATKRPYLEDLMEVVPPGARLLDYGCGIGADGLRLLGHGYRVEFADFDNPSVAFLRWRLARRGLEAEIHDLDRQVPGGFDAAYSFDVIEHVEDPFDFVAGLERRASLVCVNLLEPGPDETHLHKPLPITALLDHAAARGLVRYRRYHGRSHLVVYRSEAGRVGRLRSLAERHWGPSVGPRLAQRRRPRAR